jgi:tetratricopeptide (TPR) repeat protein
MLARLSSRLEFLTGQTRSVAARQQTLRLAIDWSYNLLTPAEQALFARLGVLIGAFTLEAAAAVAAPGLAPDSLELEELLTALADQSMVRPEPAEEPRFRMLLTLREYALEQLAAQGELEAARARHYRYYLDLAERAAPALYGQEQAAWANRLEADHDNLREALAWRLERETDGAEGMRLFAALGQFWYIRSHLEEGRRWLEQALARWPDAPPALRAEVHRGAGVLAAIQSDYAQAEALLLRALALWAEAGPAHKADTARTLRHLGMLSWARGAWEASRNYHEQSVALAREVGDEQNAANSLNGIGLVAYKLGDYDRARAYCQEALVAARAAGDLLGSANILNNLGIFAYERGDYPPAQAHLAEALALFRQLGHREGVAISLNNLGDVHRASGALAEARACYEESLASDRDHGNEAHTAYPSFGLGAAALRQGNTAAARALFEHCLAVAQRHGDRERMAQSFEGLGWVLAEEGQAQRAAWLLGAAEATRESLGEPAGVRGNRAERQSALAALQEALSAEELAAAWQAGRALEEAAALALGRE